MAISISIEIGDLDLPEALMRRTAARAARPRPLYEEFGERFKTSIEQNFRVQGRPQKWAALKRPRGKRGKVLAKTGRLKNSVEASASDRALQVGTVVEYAAVHQLGYTGPQDVPAHLRTIRQAFGRKLKKPKTVSVRGHSRYVSIPARPFILIQPDDERYLERRAVEFLLGD